MAVDDRIARYLHSLDAKMRKSHGIFYTKGELCKYLVERYIEMKPGTKILEPGCGAGYFAISLFKDVERGHYPMNSKDLLKNHLTLIDTDRGALDVLGEVLGVDPVHFSHKSFLSEDGLEDGSFDYVIGNPPYASTLTQSERQYCSRLFPENSASSKPWESAVYFMKKGIDLLKPGGRLVFVLPSTILRIESYDILREYVKRTCYVNDILDIRRAFDEVGYETVVLVLDKKDQKGLNRPSFMTTRTNIKDLGLTEHTKRRFSYDFFESRKIFPLFISDEDQQIIEGMEEDSTRLRDIAEMPRGAPINSTQMRLLESEPKEGNIPILFGRDIGKYVIRGPTKFIKWPIKKYSRIRHRHLEEKLLVQNLAYKIVATYDRQGYFVNDTINTVHLRERGSQLLYVLAILNSDAMSYYFQNAVSNRARLNIHMDSYYLGEIPIKIVSTRIREYLTDMVRDFLDSPNELRRSRIEEKVYEIYGIDDVEHIESSVLRGKKNL